MAKVLCGISGIEFQVEHLPLYLSSREYAHPVFFIPQKKLLGLYQKYRHAELNSTDSWLLFLAYLNSTDLVEWRVPAERCAQTDSIIANNFESLVSICEQMNRVRNPQTKFAKISITPDTKTLTNIKYWLANWELTFETWIAGNKSEAIKKDLAAIEESLNYLCNDANRSETLFTARLAEWADKAGNFPRFPVTLASSKSVIPCNEYWKQIIRKCTNQESIFGVPSSDLQELLEHCEEFIEAGSLYSYHLFKILKEGKDKQQSFLGLGDFSFTILSGNESSEEANKLAIINNAPEEEPNRLQYPNQFQYIKAKLAWDMKMSARKDLETPATKTLNLPDSAPSPSSLVEFNTEPEVEELIIDESEFDEIAEDSEDPEITDLDFNGD